MAELEDFFDESIQKRRRTEACGRRRESRTLTALSLGFRPRESGQLSTIIPHNHGITLTYTSPYTRGSIEHLMRSRYPVRADIYIYIQAHTQTFKKGGDNS